jgi:hypothetical protein
MKLTATISINLHSNILNGLLHPGYYATFWLADISDTKIAINIKAKIDKW